MNGTTMITFDVFNNRCVIDGELGTYVSCNGLIQINVNSNYIPAKGDLNDNLFCV